MSKRFLLILFACVAVFVGILLFTKQNAKAPNGGNNNQAATATNHTYGEGKSGVVLIEYGDFQCPACAQFAPVIKQVKEKYKDKITFQFRHFPLTSIHQHALLASRAAEAAGKQGKFFEMHDVLYVTQTEWGGTQNPQPYFESLAKQLGLDVTKFTEDVKNSETNSAVQADLAEAKKLGLNSTPSFILDGKQLTDTRDDVEYFSKLIDEAIAKKSGQQ